MRIAIVGPGIMPIPPTGWGAVEILIWDMKCALEKLGHTVLIVNTKNPPEIIYKINEFSPDFVHVQYDDFIEIVPYIQYPCAITSHFGYLEQPNKWSYYSNIIDKFKVINPNIFCLSEGIKNVYSSLGCPDDKLFVTPNGVNLDKFTYLNIGGNASIYLAKIDYRKRQHMFQSIDSLFYAGNIADNRFNPNKNYLGEWSKTTLYSDLTYYGNLVLLSDGEAHPLVCMEALVAGLGLVLSEYATANLDTTLPFISVIPENKIDDIQYVESVILENRKISLKSRDAIREYSKQFEWKNVIEKFYLPNVEKIINQNT
jgi:glycosyltransferase involved in cell wall biosynthesis